MSYQDDEDDGDMEQITTSSLSNAQTFDFAHYNSMVRHTTFDFRTTNNIVSLFSLMTLHPMYP